MSKLFSQQETAATHDRRGKFAHGNPLAWKPGQSGNPSGRPKGASFAGALAQHALAPVSDREEMAKIAQTIGLAIHTRSGVRDAELLNVAQANRLALRSIVRNGELLVGKMREEE